ncbi:MAG TPA: hypothetical protein K8V81_05345 [Brachybacterium massiliense]|uniref:Uncharacterized protein n=1 Tax=Brachybacterium massiliense TaxID=1755098 RepID=A0A921SX53_9MICO|nr:hypothetical protein [Brachybacterium massiliense]
MPQAFRFDAYIDWVALAASHRDELEIVEDWSATVRCLEIVEELRARGYDARIQAEVFILRQEARPRLFFLGRRQRRLIFDVQAGALSIYGSPDAERVLEEYQTDLTEALNRIPTEPGCLPMHAVLDSSEDGFACIYFTA